jgi:hypothetical protein
MPQGCFGMTQGQAHSNSILSAIFLLNFFNYWQFLYTSIHDFLLKPSLIKNTVIFEEYCTIDNLLFFGGLLLHWAAFNDNKYLISPSIMISDLSKGG